MVLSKWEERYQSCHREQWTKFLAPSIKTGILEPDFWTAQACGDHGCFREYTPLCECGTPETPRHVFTECRRFTAGRAHEIDICRPRVQKYLKVAVKTMWKEEQDRQRKRPESVGRRHCAM